MRTLLVIAAVGLLVAADKPKKDVDKGEKALAGTWQVNSLEMGGTPNDEAKEYSLTFSGKNFVVKKGEDVFAKGTFKINTSKKPHHIDMKVSEGVEDVKGKTLVGIYEVTKNDLKITISQFGSDERPTKFETADTTNILTKATKQKKDK
jgi:uncharacterized protein (TIGR03067 family)